MVVNPKFIKGLSIDTIIVLQKFDLDTFETVVKKILCTNCGSVLLVVQTVLVSIQYL